MWQLLGIDISRYTYIDIHIRGEVEGVFEF